MRSSFKTIIILNLLYYAFTQYLYGNLTDYTTNSITVNINYKDNSFDMSYYVNDTTSMYNRINYCLNTPATYSYGCSGIDNLCCYVLISYIDNPNVTLKKCLPLKMQNIIFNLNAPNEKTQNLNTLFLQDYTYLNSSNGKFNMKITCSSYVVHKTLKNDIMFFSSMPFNLARNACMLSDPSTNFYKCRRFGNNCCFVKITETNPNSLKQTKCIPFDNKTISAIITPDSSPPSINLIGDKLFNSKEFTLNLNKYTYRFYCNEDSLDLTHNNTNLNTYFSLKSENYTFDEKDIACLNSQSETNASSCIKKNDKGNCCFYKFNDKNDENQMVSGCIIKYRNDKGMEYTQNLNNSNILVSITCSTPTSHAKEFLNFRIFNFIILILISLII